MNIEQELVRSGFKKESKSKYVKEVNDKFLVVVEGDSELRMLYLIKKPNTGNYPLKYKSYFYVVF